MENKSGFLGLKGETKGSVLFICNFFVFPVLNFSIGILADLAMQVCITDLGYPCLIKLSFTSVSLCALGYYPLPWYIFFVID